MKRNIKTQQGSLCLFFVSKVLPVIKDSFKTVITIFIIIFTFSFGTSCKQRMNIKEFIERELARDRSNTIVFYDTSATGYNNTVYVPSIKEIIGTVNIKNEYNVGYTAVLTLDNPSQVSCFDGDKAPEITVTEAGKFQFKFTFKKEADGNASSKGAEVPVTVKLIKKEGGALFAEKRFTIRCNTPPAPCTVSTDHDAFILTLNNDTIHQDLSIVSNTITIADSTEYKKALFGGNFSAGKANISVKEIVKLNTNSKPLSAASGKRTLTGFVTDTVGLRSEEFSGDGDYTYSDKTNFSLSVKDGASSYTPISFSASGTPNTDTAEKTDYPYKLSDTKCTVKITDLAAGAVCQWNGPSGHETKNKDDECTLQPISDGTMNSITTVFTVTAEDESSKKTYQLTVGRQDGFRLSVDHSGSSSPCDIKLKNTTLTATGTFVHATDLNDGKLKVQIASKSGANLVNSIQAKIDKSDASDPAATASFYGTNTSGATKDIYGYSFELPMVQSQTLTIGYDNTISFDGNGEATIPGPPDIKVKVKDGELTIPAQYDSSSSENNPDTETIDLNTNPVLKMISNIEGGYDYGVQSYRGPFKSTKVKKIILPQGLKSLATDGVFHHQLLENLEEIVFPNGFDGDLNSLSPWYMNGKMKKITITGSKRYFTNEFTYLIERQKDGSGNYSNDNCILKYAVVETAGSVKYNDEFVSVELQNIFPSPPEYCLVIKNGNDDMGNAYEITALSDPGINPANIVFDCPTLSKIYDNVCTSNGLLKNIYIVQDMPYLELIAQNSFLNTTNLQNVYVSDSISEERFTALRDKLTANGNLSADKFKRETFTISY